MSFEIDVCNQSATHQVDLKLLRSAIEHGLQIERVESAVVSITVVDNAAIHMLNKQHLDHDYPTDVISFQLDWACDDPLTDSPAATASGRAAGCSIEGEIIVSVEYAAESAISVGWQTQDELTLYAIHGLLHICGYDDLTTSEKEIMRARERAVLGGLGLKPHYPADRETDSASEDDEPPGGCSPNPFQTAVASMDDANPHPASDAVSTAIDSVTIDSVTRDFMEDDR